MNCRILVFVFMLFSFAVGGTAQQACQAEIAVSVINASGETFRGLATQDFIPSKGTGTVKASVFDDGPRRVLFVVDTSKKLTANTRRAETMTLETLIAASRKEDSLALITARGPGGMVKFGEDRAGLTQVLTQGDTSRAKEGILDAVMDGLKWLSPSRPGDAIIVIAADLDGNHQANPKTVAKALRVDHVRMFGLALGPVIARSSVASSTVTSSVSQGLAEVKPATGFQNMEDGDTNFFPLAVNSGGLLLSIVNGSALQPSSMDDPRIQQHVKQTARQAFGMTTAFYRLQIESPKIEHPQDWLQVNEDIRKHAPAMWLLYPRELGPC